VCRQLGPLFRRAEAILRAKAATKALADEDLDAVLAKIGEMVADSMSAIPASDAAGREMAFALFDKLGVELTVSLQPGALSVTYYPLGDSSSTTGPLSILTEVQFTVRHRRRPVRRTWWSGRRTRFPLRAKLPSHRSSFPVLHNPCAQDGDLGVLGQMVDGMPSTSSGSRGAAYGMPSTSSGSRGAATAPAFSAPSAAAPASSSSAVAVSPPTPPLHASLAPPPLSPPTTATRGRTYSPRAIVCRAHDARCRNRSLGKHSSFHICPSNTSPRTAQARRRPPGLDCPPPPRGVVFVGSRDRAVDSSPSPQAAGHGRVEGGCGCGCVGGCVGG
jgi:hypothetical protein